MAIYDVDGNSIVAERIFINVKDYGAVGDGITDDAPSIRSALSALSETGGVIYFPEGIYLVKSAVLFYSNQVLLFEPGATIKQGAEIDSLMRNYSTTSIGEYDGTHDSMIIGATFDGGEHTTNVTMLGICHAKDITIKNCKFKNAYGTWHDIEINSSKYVLVENCDFDGSRKTGQNGENLQFDGASSSGNYPWGDMKVDNTVCQYIEIKGCHFHNNTISPGIGNHTNMYHKFVRIHDCIFDGNTSSRGAMDFAAYCDEIDIYDNTFNGCTKGVGSSKETYYIYNNRFVDVETPITGSRSVAHANMINGTYTA